MPTVPQAKFSTSTPTHLAPLLWHLMVRYSLPDLLSISPHICPINSISSTCLAHTGNTGFGTPVNSPTVPDIIVQPEVGIVYSTSKSKVEEHGGLSADDRNVACFVSSPRITEAQKFTKRVFTTQIAPLILEALGIDGGELEGVRAEGTKILPGFEW